MKALILAAGYGTRLYPLTKDFPKPLLEINNRPLITYILEKLAAIEDLEDIFIVTNNRFYWELEKWARRTRQRFGKFILKVFNDGTTSPDARLGAVGDINFIIEKGVVADEDLLVAGGDNLFDFGLKEFIAFSKKNAPKNVTVGLFDLQDKKKATKYGVLAIDRDNRIISFEEKPKNPKSSLIAMCLYYFPNQTLRLVNEYIKETGESDASGGYISWLCRKIPVYGFVFKGMWEDIGSFDSLCKLDGGYCRFMKEGGID
jgi:glucose-1-phosphate thymidylyltransferase